MTFSFAVPSFAAAANLSAWGSLMRYLTLFPSLRVTNESRPLPTDVGENLPEVEVQVQPHSAWAADPTSDLETETDEELSDDPERGSGFVDETSSATRNPAVFLSPRYKIDPSPES
jgi:hypothetical protein